MSRNSMFRNGMVIMAATAISFTSLFGQGKLKNGGTFTNTGTATYKEVQNYNAAGGTLTNSGTLTVTTTGGGSGDLINQGGLGKVGTVNNYSGTNAGTIVVANNVNNNFAGAKIYNGQTGAYSALRVGGAISNAGTFVTDSGKVEYNGSGAQSVIATTYGKLVYSGSNTGTLAGSVTVNDSLGIASGTLSVSTQTLTLKGATNTNSGTFTATGGTVDYAGDRDQTIIATTYKTLVLSGSSAAHTKVAAGGIDFAASGALTVGSNDTLEVSSGTLDLSANSPSFTNNNAVKVSGTATASFHGGITNAGTFYYASTSGQNIGAATYNTLRLGGSGTKTLPNATVAVLNNYTIDGGTGARSYGTGTFSFAGTSGTQTISGMDSESFYVLDFTGAALKSLSGTAMGAAKFQISSGSGTVTNDVATVTLTNITNVSMSVASGTTLVNNASKTITMNGDLENDGTITNAGTISVY